MDKSTTIERGRPSPVPPRRKVRKGTQSCWECKRRKTRCTFATPPDSTCDGCKSRQTRCISQEFRDEGAVLAKKPDRLRQMEMLIEHLAPNEQHRERREVRERRLPSLGCRELASHDELSRALLAAWPSQNKLDSLLRAPVGISVLFHGVVCMPYSNFPSKDMPSPRDMLQPPLPGSHPVLIARKLLILGTFIQGVSSCSTKDLELKSHLVETASRLVTSNDHLVGSIEGVECIMIESMYQNNAGNLRRAWLTNRRAMMLAQMMGLHKGIDSPSLRMLEPETSLRVNPEHMWFRLVSSDRYLSLMLGLPQGSLDNNFATPKILERCSPMERMERLLTMTGGLILQRNSGDLHDLTATHEIDQLLQKAAASMPSRWWVAPDLASIAGHDAKAFNETIRVMNHFAHYHILAQLHLPFLLHPTDEKYDHNKITAVNASRELLARFVSFRNSNSSVMAYCRGVDFLAFISSTTLCLAHIDAHRKQRAGNRDGAAVFHFLAHQRLGNRGMMERTLETMEEKARTGNDAIAREIGGILRQLLVIELDASNGRNYISRTSYGPDEESQCGGGVSDGGDVHIRIPYLGTVKIERSAQNGDALSLPREREQNHLDAQASVNHPVDDQESDLSVNTDWQAAPPHFDSSGLMVQTHSTEENPNRFRFNGYNGEEEHLFGPVLAESMDDWALQGVDLALFQSLFQGTTEAD
ncbi:hypothetical protein AK830_g3423 [Neonectria ditissima]|uniref:Zn(2)-C6 fungal-type domain-containing protein n=1 Tax=Neonectria ditissima TaxID=78410 RepID=A0A0P7AZ86_9HYPO|nr:hypothetical protein AK830_g3423 [Neonectria ditissima]